MVYYISAGQTSLLQVRWEFTLEGCFICNDWLILRNTGQCEINISFLVTQHNQGSNPGRSIRSPARRDWTRGLMFVQQADQQANNSTRLYAQSASYNQRETPGDKAAIKLYYTVSKCNEKREKLKNI